VKARARMLPSREEVEFLGFEAPHGTVEEWLARTRRATLHPADCGDRGEVGEGVRRPARDRSPSPSLSVPRASPRPASPSRSHAAAPSSPPSRGPATARELIPDVLRTAGRALTRSEIADMIGQSPTYVSGLLAEMEGQAVKRATTPDGKQGWTVAA
jgi:hypothetical protein